MKTINIYTCCRCGKESQYVNYISFGRYKWRTLETKYDSKQDICYECYKELKHWLAGTSDEVTHLKQEIDELEKEIKSFTELNEKLKEYNSALKKDLQKALLEFNSCKSFCPRESSLWKDFVKVHNDDLIKRHDISTDEDTIC